MANYELVFDLALKLKFSTINLSSWPLICTLPVRQKTNFCCSQHLDGDKCSEEKHSLTNYISEPRCLTERWRLMATSTRLETVSEARRLSPSGTRQEAPVSRGEITTTLLSKPNLLGKRSKNICFLYPWRLLYCCVTFSIGFIKSSSFNASWTRVHGIWSLIRISERKLR